MAAFLDPENGDLSDKVLGRITSMLNLWLKLAMIAYPILRNNRYDNYYS